MKGIAPFAPLVSCRHPVKRTLFYGLTLLLLLSLMASDLHAAEDAKTRKPFSRDTVIELAKTLASKPYEAPPVAPESLTKLDYSAYRKINFVPDAAVWGNTPTPFSIQLFAPGFLFKQLVDIDVVEYGKASPIPVTKNSFRGSTPDILKTLAKVGKYAGMRLHYPINRPDYQDEFVVFQGASYFRGVSKGQLYGLSTRGLALDVAERQGEEFPMFKRFWIERPSKHHQSIVVHALLDSESVTGAYRFGIYPGSPTRMDVDVVLFPRRDLNHVGLAPITSMFMHGSLVPPANPDYRPAVHDSEALAIKRGNGERVWRPLNNPKTLQVSAFMDTDPKGFGLIQRQRNFDHYQDLEANYHRRPSVWVEPRSEWGEGSVQLVEIPSDAESNDNIVAYWRPKAVLKQGQAYSYAYRLSWPDDINTQQESARVVRSATGNKLFNKHQEVVIDYAGISPQNIKNIAIDASISQGKILETRLQENPAIKGSRAFITFDPEDADVAELRVQLNQQGKAAAETWLHRWLKPRWLQ